MENFASKADDSLWDGRQSTVESFSRFLSSLHDKLCESEYGKRVLGDVPETKVGVHRSTGRDLEYRPKATAAPLSFAGGGDDRSLLLVSGVAGKAGNGDETRIFRKEIKANEPLHPHHNQRQELQQHQAAMQRHSPVTPWVNADHGEVTEAHAAVMVKRLPASPRAAAASSSAASHRYQAEDNYGEEAELQLVKLAGWSEAAKDDLLGAMQIHRPQTANSASSNISPRVQRQRAVAASHHQVVQTDARVYRSAVPRTSTVKREPRHRPQSGHLKLRGESREASTTSSSSRKRRSSKKGKRKHRVLRNTDFAPPPRDSWGRIKRLDHVPKGFFRKRMVVPRDASHGSVLEKQGLELNGVCV